MDLLRELNVLPPHAEREQEHRISVAFASSDGLVIDQHFGAACSLLVYRVGKTTAQVSKIGEFATIADDSGTRLAAKIEWLEGCDVIYAAAIGSSASAQLMARGVLPLRASPGSPIQGLVEVLQSELDDGVAEWLTQVTRLKKKTLPFSSRTVGLVQQEER